MECRQAWWSQTPYLRKMHFRIDEGTLEVRSDEITSSNVGDAPMLPIKSHQNSRTM